MSASCCGPAKKPAVDPRWRRALWIALVVNAVMFLAELGAGEILLTSMDRDGTKDGYDNKLNRAISEAVSIPVIASGGAGNLDHLREALTEGKADAVLAASIFHFREHTIHEARDYLRRHGIPVRE